MSLPRYLPVATRQQLPYGASFWHYAGGLGSDKFPLRLSPELLVMTELSRKYCPSCKLCVKDFSSLLWEISNTVRVLLLSPIGIQANRHSLGEFNPTSSIFLHLRACPVTVYSNKASQPPPGDFPLIFAALRAAALPYSSDPWAMLLHGGGKSSSSAGVVWAHVLAKRQRNGNFLMETWFSGTILSSSAGWKLLAAKLAGPCQAAKGLLLPFLLELSSIWSLSINPI